MATIPIRGVDFEEGPGLGITNLGFNTPVQKAVQQADPVTGINWLQKYRDLGSDGIAKGLRTGNFGLTDAERAFQLQQTIDHGQRHNATVQAQREAQAQRDAQARAVIPSSGVGAIPGPYSRPAFGSPNMGFPGASRIGMYQIPDRNFTWNTTPMEQVRMAGTMGRPDLSPMLATGEYGPLAGQRYQYLDSGNTLINYGPGGFGGWPGWGTGIGGGGGITPPGSTDIGDPGPSVGPEITTTIDDGVDFTPRHIKVIDTDAGKVYVDTNTGAYGMKDAKQIYDLDNKFLPNYSALYTDAGGGQFTRGPYALEGPEAGITGFNQLGQPTNQEFIDRIGKPYGDWSSDEEDKYIQDVTKRDYVMLDGNVVTAGGLLDRYKGDPGRDVTDLLAANRLQGAPGLGQRTPARQTNYGGYDPFAAEIARAQAQQAEAKRLGEIRARLGFGTSGMHRQPTISTPQEITRSASFSKASPDRGRADSGPPGGGRSGPSASDIRRQQEADAKREAARREADRLRISKAPKVDPKAEAAKAKKDKEKQRGIELAEKAMKEAMKRAEQLRKDREFRKKQQKKKPKSHAFF